MGDQQNADLGSANLIDPVRNHFQSIDIQAAISLVENGKGRLQHCQLKYFISLLLTAGESFIDRASRELSANIQKIHFLVKPLIELDCVEFLSSGQPRLH